MTDERRGQNPAPLYLTAELPGIGGRIKERCEDFVVEELPLYEPKGEGEHTFFEIRKIGISTFEAVRIIAQALGISPKRIGYAGLKDAQAVACQVLSVEGVPPDSVTALDLRGVQVMWAERHPHKLKIGHLRGNRFTIRIRGVQEQDLAACRSILDIVGQRGVPNWFGPQRFGLRGDSAQLGRGVVGRSREAFVRAFLGRPHRDENRAVQRARSHFDEGAWEEALNLLPTGMADERAALLALIRSGGDWDQAYAAVPKRLKVFFLSAYQSALFNRVLEIRLSTLDRVFAGDLAMKHPGHSVFEVQDEAAEQSRASRFEISPTGPIYGYKMLQAGGQEGQLEAGILDSEGLVLEDFRVGDGIKARGGRRALRFRVYEPEVWHDDGLMLGFWLARGCYATAVLAEVMKVPLGPRNHPSVSAATEL